MGDIQWLTPLGEYKRSTKDVSVTINKYGNQKPKTRITFRNESWLKITHDAHIQVGIDDVGGRMCFRDGIIYGNKVSGKGGTRFVQLPKAYEEFIGDYDLQMAGTGDYFFIKKD